MLRQNLLTMLAVFLQYRVPWRTDGSGPANLSQQITSSKKTTCPPDTFPALWALGRTTMKPLEARNFCALLTTKIGGQPVEDLAIGAGD